MHKFPTWYQITGFCFILSSSLNCEETRLPSQEILNKIEVDISGHFFANGEDLIVLADGRKIRGVIEKLPDLQFPFGTLSFPAENLGLVTVEKNGDRDIIKLITRNGQEYITQLPEEKLRVRLVNYVKNIDLNFIQFIVSHNLSEFTPIRKKLYAIELRNGDVITAEMLDTKIHVDDGSHDWYLNPADIVDIEFDGKIAGKVQVRRSEKALENVEVLDEWFPLQIASSGKYLKMPWDMIVRIKRSTVPWQLEQSQNGLTQEKITQIGTFELKSAIDEPKNAYAHKEVKEEKLENSTSSNAIENPTPNPVGILVRATPPVEKDLALPPSTKMTWSEEDIPPRIAFAEEEPTNDSTDDENCAFDNEIEVARPFDEDEPDEIESIEISSLPMRVFTENEPDEVESIEISSLPMRVFTENADLDLPHETAIASYPTKIFCDSDVCIVSRDIEIKALPAKLWKEDTTVFEPINIKEIPVRVFTDNTEIDVPHNTTVASFPVKIFCDSDSCKISGDLNIKTLPVKIWEENVVAEVPHDVVLRQQPIAILTESLDDLPKDVTIKSLPVALFTEDEAKSTSTQNITLSLWPLRKWDDELTSTSAPTINITSMPSKRFIEVIELELPSDFDIERGIHNLTFPVIAALQQKDIPRDIEVRCLPSLLFADFEVQSAIPEEIAFMPYPEPVLTGKWSFGVPKHISIVENPKTNLGILFEVPDIIAVRDSKSKIRTAPLYEQEELMIPLLAQAASISDDFVDYPIEYQHSLSYILQDDEKAVIANLEDIWNSHIAILEEEKLAPKSQPATDDNDEEDEDDEDDEDDEEEIKQQDETIKPSVSLIDSWKQKVAQVWNSYSNSEKAVVVNSEEVSPEENGSTDESSVALVDSRRVTNAEYREFVQAMNHRYPPHWPEGSIPEGMEDRPVSNVSYLDAWLYAEWKGKRLPSDKEWLQAAKEPGKLEGAHDFFNEWVLSEVDPTKRRSKTSGYSVIQGNSQSQHSVRPEKDEFNAHTGFRCVQD